MLYRIPAGPLYTTAWPTGPRAIRARMRITHAFRGPSFITCIAACRIPEEHCRATALPGGLLQELYELLENLQMACRIAYRITGLRAYARTRAYAYASGAHPLPAVLWPALAAAGCAVSLGILQEL